MTNRKVQVAAATFARRRVVGGLVRPGSGNAGEGAPRPFRWTVGSAFAAVAVVAAAAVMGYLDPPDKSALQSDLIADEQGVQYVMLAGALHPVLDSTTAHLLLGPAPTVTTAPEKALAPYRGNLGSTVGIRGLPPRLPSPDALDLRDWTLCTADGRTVVEVGYPMPAGAQVLDGADGALWVADERGRQFVLDDGVAYPVQDRRAVPAAVRSGGLKPRRVPSDWLAGLPTGEPLTPTSPLWRPQPPVSSPLRQDARGYLCAWFQGSFDEQGRAQVVMATSPSLPAPADPGRTLVVAPGHGAVVRAVGSDPDGVPGPAPRYLLTDSGTRHELVGDAAVRLGYDGVAATEVPASWLRHVPLGPALDPARAARPASVDAH